MTISPTDYKYLSTINKQRIHKGSFQNPDGGIPSMVFDEELVTYDPISERTVRNEVGSCIAQLDNPSKPLTLRNPVDDTVIPVTAFITKIQTGVTYGDVMIINYSLGRQAQIERDEALIAARLVVVA